MSQQTKESAQQVKKHLEGAQTYIKEAERHAQNTKDPALQQRVTKIKTDIQQTHEELSKKLDNKTG